jgi:hypothetical protein
MMIIPSYFKLLVPKLCLGMQMDSKLGLGKMIFKVVIKHGRDILAKQSFVPKLVPKSSLGTRKDMRDPSG